MHKNKNIQIRTPHLTRCISSDSHVPTRKVRANTVTMNRKNSVFHILRQYRAHLVRLQFSNAKQTAAEFRRSTGLSHLTPSQYLSQSRLFIITIDLIKLSTRCVDLRKLAQTLHPCSSPSLHLVFPLFSRQSFLPLQQLLHFPVRFPPHSQVLLLAVCSAFKGISLIWGQLQQYQKTGDDTLYLLATMLALCSESAIRNFGAEVKRGRNDIITQDSKGMKGPLKET